MGSSCYSLKQSGASTNGVYDITVDGTAMKVYCDMEHNGGGWTLVAQFGCASGSGDEPTGTCSTGTWPLPECGGYTPKTDWTSVTDASIEPATGTRNMMSCHQINALKADATLAGLSGDEAGIWMTTPGDTDATGGAIGGAQNLGRHDCTWKWQHTDAELAASQCRYTKWCAETPAAARVPSAWLICGAPRHSPTVPPHPPVLSELAVAAAGSTALIGKKVNTGTPIPVPTTRSWGKQAVTAIQPATRPDIP